MSNRWARCQVRIKKSRQKYFIFFVIFYSKNIYIFYVIFNYDVNFGYFGLFGLFLFIEWTHVIVRYHIMYIDKYLKINLI